MSLHYDKHSGFRPTTIAFALICADAAAYVAQLGRHKDVSWRDACNRTGIAPELDTVEFYRNTYRCCPPEEYWSQTCATTGAATPGHVGKIRVAFGDAFFTLQVRSDGNVIVFAFKQPKPVDNWAQLLATAVELKARFGLNFPKYVKRLEMDWNQRALAHLGAASQYDPAQRRNFTRI